MIVRIKNRSGRFLTRHKRFVLFNKNLIISATAGFIVSALATQIYAKNSHNNLTTSGIALAVEYAVYIPLFVLLFYIDNRSRYVDASTGQKNTRLIRQDVKKLLAAFSISEVIYSLARFVTQYYLLEYDIEPYQASMISDIIAWTVFFVAINSIANLVKLFRER